MNNKIYYRWVCPECGRIDPGHPDTLPKDMPESHTSFSGWDYCYGKRNKEVSKNGGMTWGKVI